MLGKRKKFCKGPPSGFVPDYRHSVNEAAESEGFGSCDRADSGDSWNLKSRRVASNGQASVAFDIPTEVISFSKISPLERRNLEVRLTAELEQIRMFQKKVLTDSGETVATSSSNWQQKKHPAALPVTQKTQCARVPGKPTAAKQGSGVISASGNSNAAMMKQCEALLQRLMSHKYAKVFNTPVDVVRWNIPDYFSIIKHPMDLGTVKSKISSGAYSNPWDFFSDVKLTFTNAMTYNPPKNEVHIMACALSKYFEGRWKLIEKKLSVYGFDPNISRGNSDVKVSQNSTMKAPPKKTAFIRSASANTIKKMSNEDKEKLSNRLTSLAPELPKHIMNFLKDLDTNKATNDEIELDMEALGDEILFKLQSLLDDHFKDRGVPDVACPMKVLHDSAIRSSSIPAMNESSEEDVDIGDNDTPMPSYPPVEIEKDSNIRCSSSSSEYGSSSSEDSAGSSGAECEIVKASSPAANKENLSSRVLIDQQKSDIMNLADESRFPDRSDQLHLKTPHSKTASQTENGPIPGENTVTSEKVYQNALKVKRFADTILRAREKTLDKYGKGDPERLLSKKEEFEQIQREEKARLLAEARVAEEAQKQAQAAATAEIRRQREIEREAARKALSQMEKTVEIDESSQFLKDLEMLQCHAAEHLPSSVDETSPVLSQDKIGILKLTGSNPLEKLGLFMRVDDDDEDDAELGHHVVTIAEEGEID